jgi:uncharacterized protein YkwD
MRSWSLALVSAACMFVGLMNSVVASPLDDQADVLGRPSTPAVINADADKLAAEVIALSNAERLRQGLRPLDDNPLLDRVAQTYASVLAEGTCFGHTCGDLPDLRERVDVVHYDWRGLGENVAGGQPTPSEVVKDWLESPGHRANLLNPAFQEIGVGVITGPGEFGIYWVQVIGN